MEENWTNRCANILGKCQLEPGFCTCYGDYCLWTKDNPKLAFEQWQELVRIEYINPVSPKDYVDDSEPHEPVEGWCTGKVQCNICHHRWVGVFPAGTLEFKCPKCNTMTGYLEPEHDG